VNKLGKNLSKEMKVTREPACFLILVFPEIFLLVITIGFVLIQVKRIADFLTSLGD